MPPGRVVIYGANGALGSAILKHFKNHNYWTFSIASVANDGADVNVIVDRGASWSEQELHILKEYTSESKENFSRVSTALGSEKLEAILTVAGGWMGGNASSENLVDSAEAMWKQSVWSSVVAARLAALHLKEGGLLQLTGAAAAVDGTPSMIGYGMAKAAVHQLVKSLAEANSGLPRSTTTLAILPASLDTPMNRKWTPLEFMAEQLETWTRDSTKRPPSGSLLKLITSNGTTEILSV